MASIREILQGFKDSTVFAQTFLCLFVKGECSNETVRRLQEENGVRVAGKTTVREAFHALEALGYVQQSRKQGQQLFYKLSDMVGPYCHSVSTAMHLNRVDEEVRQNTLDVFVQAPDAFRVFLDILLRGTCDALIIRKDFGFDEDRCRAAIDTLRDENLIELAMEPKDGAPSVFRVPFGLRSQLSNVQNAVRDKDYMKARKQVLRVCKCGNQFMGAPNSFYCPKCRKSRAQEASARTWHATKKKKDIVKEKKISRIKRIEIDAFHDAPDWFRVFLFIAMTPDCSSTDIQLALELRYSEVADCLSDMLDKKYIVAKRSGDKQVYSLDEGKGRKFSRVIACMNANYRIAKDNAMAEIGTDLGVTGAKDVPDGFLTIRQFADKVGATYNAVRGWCQKGKLDGIIRSGVHFLIPEDAVPPEQKKNVPDGYLPMTVYAAKNGIDYKTLMKKIGDRDIPCLYRCGVCVYVPGDYPVDKLIKDCKRKPSKPDGAKEHVGFEPDPKKLKDGERELRKNGYIPIREYARKWLASTATVERWVQKKAVDAARVCGALYIKANEVPRLVDGEYLSVTQYAREHYLQVSDVERWCSRDEIKNICINDSSVLSFYIPKDEPVPEKYRPPEGFISVFAWAKQQSARRGYVLNYARENPIKDSFYIGDTLYVPEDTVIFVAGAKKDDTYVTLKKFAKTHHMKLEDVEHLCLARKIAGVFKDENGNYVIPADAKVPR